MAEKPTDEILEQWGKEWGREFMDLKRTKEALWANEEQCRNVAETGGDICVNQDVLAKYINKQLVNIVGHSVKRWLARYF